MSVVRSVVRSKRMKLGALLAFGGVATTAMAAGAGCSGGAQGAGSPGSGTDATTGSVGLALTLPDGSHINSVAWALRDSNGQLVTIPGTANPGTVSTAESQTIAFQIGDIPAGTNDSISLSATTTNGATCLGTASGINIVARTVQKVQVVLVCTPAGVDAGNLSVTGTIATCGAWTGLSTTTSDLFVGESLTLTATAAGPDTNNLGYTWSQSSEAGVVGVLGTTQDEAAGPTDANSFMCTAPGSTTVTVVVDDGAASTANCPAAVTTVSTTITCEPATQIESAWVELGSGGAAIARAITASPSCPAITLNGGAPQPMNLRVGAAAEPLRSTTSASLGAQFSKPSYFPVNTCELPLPAGTTSAVVAGQSLPLPKANPARVVVLGDTGCRMKAAIPASGSQFQGCNDPTQYPLAQLSTLAASLKPDLVLHVGDYQYRENECPPDQSNCAGSPWGYGWDTWQADFFVRHTATLTPLEMRGLKIFKDPDKGACDACHRFEDSSNRPWRSLFTDYGYDALAAPRNRAIPANADSLVFDLGLCERKPIGRALASSAPNWCSQFRTPSLRNVAVRERFMHNGAFTQLRDVVAFYATRSTNPERWYPKGAKFDDVPAKYRANVNVTSLPYNRREGVPPAYDDADVDAIVAFLETLTDAPYRSLLAAK